MDFSAALAALRDGKRVTRRVWQSGARADWAGSWLELVPAGKTGDGREIMPQLMVGYPDGPLRPFSGANFDLLADDWEMA